MSDAAPAAGASARSRLGRLLQLTVSLLLLGFLLSRLDRRALVLVARVPVLLLVSGFSLMAASQVWGGLRLALLVRTQGAALGYPAAVRLTFIGLFVSNFLPSTIGGDLGKAAFLLRTRVPKHVSVLALVADRALNLLAAVALTIVGVLATRLWSALPAAVIGWMSVAAVGFLSLAMVALLLRRPLAGLFAKPLRGIGQRLGPLDGYRRILARWLSSPVVWTLGLVLSLLSFLSSVIAQWLLLPSLGIDAGLAAFTAILGIVYLLGLIPVSFNGIGVQEYLLALLLTGIGAEQQAAVVLALLSRLLLVGTSLLGAFFLATER